MEISVERSYFITVALDFSSISPFRYFAISSFRYFVISPFRHFAISPFRVLNTPLVRSYKPTSHMRDAKFESFTKVPFEGTFRQV